MPQSDPTMPDAGQVPSPPTRKPRGGLLALVSLVLFVAGAMAGARSFLACDGVQRTLAPRRVTEGPVRTRIMRYEASLSRGSVALFVVRDDFTEDAGG
jgi:hypothetical protein